MKVSSNGDVFDVLFIHMHGVIDCSSRVYCLRCVGLLLYKSLLHWFNCILLLSIFPAVQQTNSFFKTLVGLEMHRLFTSM